MRREEDKDKLEEKVLLIRRISKKTTGGNYVTFSALVAVGDKKGKVGIGLGRGLEVPQAIRKASAYAKKHMIDVPIVKSTIPHATRTKFKAAILILKPAAEGAGLKVGSVVRSILNLAGVSNASGKILRSRNQIVNSYVVMKALSTLKTRKP
jgi:small subunit ribosomal protein S5